MGVTVHFINKDVSIQSVCLGCEKFDEKHTIVNLIQFLKSTIQEWKIDNKIIAVVSDNASNIVGAIKQCNFRHIPCFAHTINLIVQKGLKSIQVIQKKVKSIVEHFKRSSYALSKLQATQQQMGLPLLKLIQDIITRWNSTYDMFKRIIQIKDAIISTMALHVCDVEPLTPTEWLVVECSAKILQIFTEVTTEISSEKYISISKVLIFINVMISTMDGFKKNSALPKEGKELAKILYDDLFLIFAGYEDKELLTQAALLDPRFKKLAFNGYSAYKLQIAIDQLKNKACQVTIPGSEDPNIVMDHSLVNAGCSTSILWKNFDEQYSQNININPTAAGIIEVDKYLREPIIRRHEDPLNWWNIHKALYPRLFIMVQKRLCVPATSIPCERLFSKAGLVITERRNRMLAKKSSQVLFLNQNL